MFNSFIVLCCIVYLLWLLNYLYLSFLDGLCCKTFHLLMKDKEGGRGEIVVWLREKREGRGSRKEGAYY